VGSLPPVTYSRERDFRLIRPLVFVTEDLTAQYAASLGAPVTPCGCSLRTGTVRRSLRDIIGTLEQDYPHLKETMLAAMGNIQTGRLLDPRYLDLEANGPIATEDAPEAFAEDMSEDAAAEDAEDSNADAVPATPFVIVG
jgi:tRNA 2-thiocytidine biosynthesis protein TtcA